MVEVILSQECKFKVIHHFKKDTNQDKEVKGNKDIFCGKAIRLFMEKYKKSNVDKTKI